MSYKQSKQLKGAIYFIAFILIAVGFHIEPTKAVLSIISQYGIPHDVWTVMFLVSAVLVAVQTILVQRWNFITFTPYFMYAGALFMLRVADVSGTAISSITIVVVLALIMLTDVLLDWGK